MAEDPFSEGTTMGDSERLQRAADLGAQGKTLAGGYSNRDAIRDALSPPSKEQQEREQRVNEQALATRAALDAAEKDKSK